METAQNPADDASRGLYAPNLIESNRWWNGPEFLWNSLENQSFLDGTDPTTISPDDPEVKISAMATQAQEHFSLSDRLKCFSTWHKAKRAVAVCLRFQKKYKGTGSDGQKQLKSGDPDTDVAKEKAKTQAFMSTEPRAARYVPVDTQDLQEAEKEIIRSLQREEFENEISLVHRIGAQVPHDLTQLRTMKKASSLYKMDPFLDKDGI